MSFNELMRHFGFSYTDGCYRKGEHKVATVAGGWGLWSYTGPRGKHGGIDKESLAALLRTI